MLPPNRSGAPPSASARSSVGDRAVEAEIEENLLRRELDAAQRAILTVRRQEIIEQKEAGAVSHVGTPLSRQAKRGAGIKTGPTPGSSASVSAASGRSKSAVHRDLRRAKIISTPVLERVAGTSLATGVELDALAKLPEPEREVIVAKAQAEAAKPEPERVQVSAVEVLRAKAPEPTAGHSC